MRVIFLLIYLEFIEFKFCELNKYLKKNIEIRSSIEYNINNTLYEEEE